MLPCHFFFLVLWPFGRHMAYSCSFLYLYLYSWQQYSNSGYRYFCPKHCGCIFYRLQTYFILPPEALYLFTILRGQHSPYLLYAIYLLASERGNPPSFLFIIIALFFSYLSLFERKSNAFQLKDIKYEIWNITKNMKSIFNYFFILKISDI